MEQESKTADIEPQITENSTSTEAESSSLRPLESAIDSLMEVVDHYMLIRSWSGQFSSKEKRLRSYDDYQWPRDVKPTPDALSEAGFYAIGR